ncbi:hypothetical protein ASG90_18805 [Nocardioides sp. Soil797]|nr:hypothetical protein ASG90_18805 [Nocardioides sp. Soil797]
MPRAADPAVREKLLSVAAHVLAVDGPRALSTRRLAAEAGTSTMSVYTYFGGMDQLRRELRRDGFARLCVALDDVPSTPDPVADLAAAVLTYVTVGVDNPAVYRALFVDSPPERDDDAGAGVHDRLTDLVRRCAEAGRFDLGEPALASMWAAEVWLTAHGAVHLTQAGLLAAEPIRFLATDMLYRLLVGYGDRPERARASIDEAAGSGP